MAVKTPRVFISHSSLDKPIARRVARRLSHYGIGVWIDERELKLTEALFLRFQKEIRASTHFIVILTPNALNSEWVAREIKVAQSGWWRKPSILPLMFDDSVTYPIWDTYKGAVLTHPLKVETALERLALSILGRQELPPPQTDKVAADLERVRAEDPKLSMFFDSVDGKYAPKADRVEAIYAQGFEFHTAEFALWCAYLLADPSEKEMIARDCCAWVFGSFGIGSRPLGRYLAGDDGVRDDYVSQVLSTATFRRLGRSDLLDCAFDFYASLQRERHTQFAAFLHKNFDDFTEAHRMRVLNYIFRSDRGPGGSFDAVASVSYDRMPESAALKNLWRSWIKDGLFVGAMGIGPKQEPSKTDTREPATAEYLFRHMKHAARDGYHHYAQLDETIGYFVREQFIWPQTALHGLDFVATAQKEDYLNISQVYDEAAEGLGSPQWAKYDSDNALVRKFKKALRLAASNVAVKELFEAVEDLEHAMANAPSLSTRF